MRSQRGSAISGPLHANTPFPRNQQTPTEQSDTLGRAGEMIATIEKEQRTVRFRIRAPPVISVATRKTPARAVAVFGPLRGPAL
ncbi:MAG: hypothetical protein WBP81_17140 [Solirubrobacteraceae bacterium]